MGDAGCSKSPNQMTLLVLGLGEGRVMGKSIAGWALEMPPLLSAPHPNRFGGAGNRKDLCPHTPTPRAKLGVVESLQTIPLDSVALSAWQLRAEFQGSLSLLGPTSSSTHQLRVTGGRGHQSSHSSCCWAHTWTTRWALHLLFCGGQCSSELYFFFFFLT